MQAVLANPVNAICGSRRKQKEMWACIGPCGEFCANDKSHAQHTLLHFIHV